MHYKVGRQNHVKAIRRTDLNTNDFFKGSEGVYKNSRSASALA